MNPLRKRNLTALLFVFFTFPVMGLTVKNRPATGADFLVMDNLIEGNVYFTTFTNGTRVTGSTAFTSAPEHSGLVYISDGGDQSFPPRGNYRISVWSESSPVDRPYDGLHCWKYLSDCIDSIRYPNSTTRTTSGFTINSAVSMGGNTDHALNPKISMALANYLLQLPIGASYTDTMNRCYTTVTGNTPCKDVNGGTSLWERTQVTLTKKAHLKFAPVNSRSVLMLTSNGETILLPGSQDCEVQQDGVVCKHINLDYQNGGIAGIDNLSLIASITDGNISSKMSPGDIKVSFNKTTWYNIGAQLPFRELLNGNNVGIHVYLSKKMLTILLANGYQDKLSKLIKFNVRNAVSPGSGFYEFFGSSNIELVSRKPHIAISSADGQLHPHKVATVGKENLSFEYVITESGYSNAESIDISLRQNTGLTYNGLCTFYPSYDSDIRNAVAIHSKIVLQGNNGVINAPIKCDAIPINMRELGMKSSTPPILWTDLDGKGGLTQSYDIKLEFDLKSPSARRTTEGFEWEGEVHQSGTIQVKGIWK
ncbi:MULTISPECIES: hypothetical protein [Aeromonas]|nr:MULTISPECIES: hypothetical protein [Aeromonas]QLI59479.1 hypothetical protein C1C92_22185 [Aeromonas caviae]QLL78912.1 hypothetical protein GWC92_00290 [Aeromonas caviae]QXB99999.1 hypothetical protein I6L48_03430 [Aeromonas sp. FDAARGOS 1418]UBS65530.1 hypothetical protein LCG53_00270 [Aeromonas caviae]WKS84997.1 hypothetical protein NHU86_00345 [Aeromonas caviae]